LKTDRRINKTAVVLITYGSRYFYFSKLIERLLSMGIGFIIAVDNNSNLDSKKALLKYSLGNKSKIYIIEASEQK